MNGMEWHHVIRWMNIEYKTTGFPRDFYPKTRDSLGDFHWLLAGDLLTLTLLGMCM